LTDASCILSIQKGTFQGDAVGTRAQDQLVCSSSDDGAAVSCLDDDALVDGSDAVGAVVE
jgi:hypothetical protein